MRAAQREDFQREEGPSKQPLPEIRGCHRGRGCDVGVGALLLNRVSVPQPDSCPKQPAPCGTLGTLRPREARVQGHMVSQRPRQGEDL